MTKHKLLPLSFTLPTWTFLSSYRCLRSNKDLRITGQNLSKTGKIAPIFHYSFSSLFFGPVVAGVLHFSSRCQVCIRKSPQPPATCTHATHPCMCAAGWQTDVSMQSFHFKNESQKDSNSSDKSGALVVPTGLFLKVSAVRKPGGPFL